jgi:hypothetical protein
MHLFGLNDRVVRYAVGIAAAAVLGATAATALAAGAHTPPKPTAPPANRWVAGDIHTHSWMTDGSHPELEVLNKGLRTYGLGYIASNEHGGFSSNDPFGNPIAKTPRWWTIQNYSWPIVRDLRIAYPYKRIIEGMEWNAPKHEHSGMAVVSNEPSAVAAFEYMFDQSDSSTSGPLPGLTKQNVGSLGTTAGVEWLRDNFPTTSYVSPEHPSRKGLWSISDFRDMNDRAPNIAFSFEGIPGHQRDPGGRGGYSQATTSTSTYGGADYMVAKVGGLWDAMLGEGRRWFTVTNSDFHATDGDFWPGEYSKTYTYVKGNSLQALVDGMRSGRQFVVLGDLVNGFEFQAQSGHHAANMGDKLTVKKGSNANIVIRFRSPAMNNNGDKPRVDHVDLIMGKVTGKVDPSSPEYNNPTNPTTKVVARFWTKGLKKGKDGWYTIVYRVNNVQDGMYFRVRGTNQAVGAVNQVDGDGSPIKDSAVGPNSAAEAFKDLWFYGNPVWVMPQDAAATSGHALR